MTKSNSIATLPKTSCTGCKMCGDLCPKHCISYTEDREGFFYPQVNEDLCVDCGVCKKKCPALCTSFNDKIENAHSAYATDERMKASGSSGGGILSYCITHP